MSQPYCALCFCLRAGQSKFVLPARFAVWNGQSSGACARSTRGRAGDIRASPEADTRIEHVMTSLFRPHTYAQILRRFSHAISPNPPCQCQSAVRATRRFAHFQWSFMPRTARRRGTAPASRAYATGEYTLADIPKNTEHAVRILAEKTRPSSHVQISRFQPRVAARSPRKRAHKFRDPACVRETAVRTAHECILGALLAICAFAFLVSDLVEALRGTVKRSSRGRRWILTHATRWSTFSLRDALRCDRNNSPADSPISEKRSQTFNLLMFDTNE